MTKNLFTIIAALLFLPLISAQDIETQKNISSEFHDDELFEFAELIKVQNELENRCYEKIKKLFEREGFEIKFSNINHLMGLQLSCDKDIAMMDKQDLKAFMRAEKRAMKALWKMNRKYQRHLKRCELDENIYREMATKYLNSEDFRQHIQGIHSSTASSTSIDSLSD